MLVGAFVAITSTYFIRNYTSLGMAYPVVATYLGVLCAIVFGGLLGLFFAWMHVVHKAHLVVLAIAINLLAISSTVYIMRVLFGQAGTWSDPSIVQLPEYSLSFVEGIPIVGRIFSGYNIVVYISWMMGVFLWILFYKTRLGRYIQATGENEEAAKAVGISTDRIKYFALVVGGALSSLGGAFLSVGHLTLFTRNMSSDRGWIGNAAALFGFNRPGGSFLAGLFFGFADGAALRLQNITKIPPYFVQLFPYVLTLVVLSVVSFRVMRRSSRNTPY